jgi:hypothetical protein
MRSLFRRLLATRTSDGRRARPPRTACPLKVEALEDRVLASRTGTEFLVPTANFGVNDQSQSASASSLNGRTVVVWTDRVSSTDTNIKARICDANGNASPEIVVANSAKPEHHPAVAIDGQGDFVVAWTLDYSSYDKDIKAARFAWDGTRLGSTITVRGSTANEYDPKVAMDRNGAFVVSYTVDGSTTGSQDVWGSMYTEGGSYIRGVHVAAGSFNEANCSIASAANGRFAIAYLVQGSGVTVKRYDASGALQSSLLVGQGSAPSLAMDYWGNAVVAFRTVQIAFIRDDYWTWINDHITAVRIDEYGGMSAPFNVASSNVERLNSPAVALDPWNGRFVVAYQGDLLRVAEVSGFNQVVNRYSLAAAQNWTTPGISINGNHRYLVTYTTLNQGSYYGTDIFGQFGQL